MMPGRPAPMCSPIHSATFASHGHRSSSSSSCPEAILSTLAAGCKSSPSSKSHPKRPASSPATVDFPQPETPINTNTGGCPGDALTMDTVLSSSATPRRYQLYTRRHQMFLDAPLYLRTPTFSHPLGAHRQGRHAHGMSKPMPVTVATAAPWNFATAGVDTTVTALWLGHESIDATRLHTRRHEPNTSPRAHHTI